MRSATITRIHATVFTLLLAMTLTASPASAAWGSMKPPSTSSRTPVVEIVYFGDFQCPYSARFKRTLRQILQIYGDRVRVTFLHNPLSFHEDARAASIAAVAAQRQGSFWRMFDMLFDNQRALKPKDLERYAKAVGLDLKRYAQDIANPAAADFVDRNRAIAAAIGATSTPTFFINGKVLRGVKPFAEFEALIDAEIAQADEVKQNGDQWVAGRTLSNSPKLHALYISGKTPPRPPPLAKKPAREDERKTVYKVDVDPAVDAILGDSDKALVTLVEFADFQCPFCKRFAPVLALLSGEYGTRVRVVFKHHPLPFHEQADEAAGAAICAQAQGKFWDMHDLLFVKQDALGPADLSAHATEIGLDLGAFEGCMKAGKYVTRIAADQKLAGRVTALGTPTTFVNGRKVSGVQSPEELRALIDAELAKAKKLAGKGGKSGHALYETIIAGGKVFEPLDEKVNTFSLDDAPMKGDKGAKIQIVLFADFQCPFSARVRAPLDQVKKHYGDEAVVVYKHFPLSFHKDAMPAALASRCAQEQGRFWQYHDLLFANQKALKSKDLEGYAKQLGLDQAKFDACLGGRKHERAVKADMQAARAANVRGTPTIFINGRKFTSPTGYDERAITSVIDKHVLGK